MNLEELRDYCLSLRAATEDFPFDESVLAFRVGGKIFALCNVDDYDSINLKCDPQIAVQLREEYEHVRPGYHMNKKHWNTVYFGGSFTRKQIEEWILHSYDLIFRSLPKKKRQEILGD